MRDTALDNIGATGGMTGSSMLAIVTHHVWPIRSDCNRAPSVADERLAAMSDAIRAVPESVLDDLGRRLQNTRWPAVEEGQGWARGSDTFHRVVPSLPGFGFSQQPTNPGWTPARMADGEPEAFAGELIALAQEVN
jgi:hypothetical protein